MSTTHDTEHLDHVKCPHCGHESDVSGVAYIGVVRSHTRRVPINCYECGKRLIVTETMTVRFRTENLSTNFGTEQRDDPICPHCGNVAKMARTFDAFYTPRRGEAITIECAICYGRLAVMRHVTVTYSTRKLEDE